MDAPKLFSTLIMQGRCVLAREYSHLPAYHGLLKAGLIEETGVAQSLVCDECDNPHDAEIIYENQCYGYYCYDLGFVKKKRSELITAQANIPVFITQLSDALGCKRRKSSPLNNVSYRIGTLQSHAGDVVLYFHPTMQNAADLDRLQSALAHEIKSGLGVVLTTKGHLKVSPYITVLIEDILSFDPESSCFNIDVDIFSLAGGPIIHKGGRPKIYKEKLVTLIQTRKKEGKNLEGVNAEAKAIQTAYSANYPDEKPPSRTTIKRYISNS